MNKCPKCNREFATEHLSFFTRHHFEMAHIAECEGKKVG
jgi:hypothetical protein